MLFLRRCVPRAYVEAIEHSKCYLPILHLCPAFTGDTQYGESSSLYHLDHDDSGLYDSKDISEVIGGIRDSILATKIGKKLYKVTQAYGSTYDSERILPR